MINLVNSVYQINYVKLHQTEKLKTSLKRELQILLGVDETRKQRAGLMVDFYGLTGAGFQFKDNNIKVMCRHTEYNELLKKYVLPKIKSKQLVRGSKIVIDG